MIKFRVLVFEKENVIKNFIDDNKIIVNSCTDIKLDHVNPPAKSADLIILDKSCYNRTDVFKFVADNSDTSIIVVNAHDAFKYQIYECGAVDVMLQPLDKIELKYKVEVMVKNRRYKPNRYYLGDLVYEVDTGTLTKEDKSIVLPAMQNKIFALLLNGYYDNRIVKKEEVFKSMIDESSRIQNHIARLRYSLTYIKSRNVVIETVYGKGYKLLMIDK